MTVRVWREGVDVAGLIGGPAAWAVSTQLNYALAPLACRYTTLIIALPAAALVLLALAGGVLSWPAWQRHSGTTGIMTTHAMFTQEDGRAQKFVAALGVLSAVLFAVVIIMQGVAALVLNGCMK
jgi:hypothetical protein